MKNLSIIIPVYGCSLNLKSILEGFDQHIPLLQREIAVEVLLIDDASKDNAWEVLTSYQSTNYKIRAIKLAKNIGQHHAVNLGLYLSQAKFYLIMDCDGQTSVKSALKIFDRLVSDSVEIVFTTAQNKKNPITKKLLTSLYYTIARLVKLKNSGVISKQTSLVCFTGKVRDILVSTWSSRSAYLQELNSLNITSSTIEIDHILRTHGKSTYSFSKLVKLAIDRVLNDQNKIYLGVFIAGTLAASWSALSLIYLLISYLNRNSPEGWLSIITTISILLSINLISLGATLYTVSTSNTNDIHQKNLNYIYRDHLYDPDI